MAFLETPRFPGCVAFGAISGPNYSTVRTVVASGHDDVVIRYEQAIHRYTFEHANRTQIEHDELLEFFHAVKGMGHRFRIKDYTDYQCTTSNGVLRPLHGSLQVGSAGFGWGTSRYLLQKLYNAGALGTYRDINKPVSPVAIYRNGVLQTLTTHYTIDYATGIITFVADESDNIASHTPGASHVLTLATPITASIGQRIYVTATTGSAATTLNDQSHEISNVGGGGTIITITTTTTGLTAAAGIASMYPQFAQTLLWAGEFDVPVRFLSDEASFEIVQRAGTEGGLLYSWSGINLTEVRIQI